jgi:hypothetical protein
VSVCVCVDSMRETEKKDESKEANDFDSQKDDV